MIFEHLKSFFFHICPFSHIGGLLSGVLLTSCDIIFWHAIEVFALPALRHGRRGEERIVAVLLDYRYEVWLSCVFDIVFLDTV